MRPETRFREIAEQMAEYASARASQHQRELKEAELRKAEIEAKLRSANAALDRLANFQVKIGADYQCPACWIENETKAILRPVGGGTDADDFFRCNKCGAEFNVPSVG
ncbi:MAG TPA: hypothetical protein VGP48_09945 [Stellaceae bacterium]|jgi:predicted methyltransferase MtxX (methanogen marker protein 4)|nr:hypothetical protein [Stellaceae bacterium]